MIDLDLTHNFLPFSLNLNLQENHCWKRSSIGGRGEIRTHGGREPSTVFKTVALNRSATLPIGERRAL